MKITFAKSAFAAALSLFAVSSAFAGSFETYSLSDTKSKRVTVVVSFAGDGVTQDSQVDLDYPAGLTLVKATAKVAGSVCVGIAGNKIRVVPPSGAGKALPSAATDYCSFSFAAQKGLQTSNFSFKPSFTECAAPGGVQSCSHQDQDVTQ